MNERIAKLYDQAIVIEDGGDYVCGELDPAKFAELIVRECAQVSEDDISDGDACCTNTADRIARQIKKHFGVDE